MAQRPGDDDEGLGVDTRKKTNDDDKFPTGQMITLGELGIIQSLWLYYTLANDMFEQPYASSANR